MWSQDQGSLSRRSFRDAKSMISAGLEARVMQVRLGKGRLITMLRKVFCRTENCCFGDSPKASAARWGAA